jgi:hypothetical protein
MMTKYEVVNELFVKRIDVDGKEWWIPTDAANSDYQRYLRWLENPDADEAQSL